MGLNMRVCIDISSFLLYNIGNTSVGGMSNEVS